MQALVGGAVALVLVLAGSGYGSLRQWRADEPFDTGRGWFRPISWRGIKAGGPWFVVGLVLIGIGTFLLDPYLSE
jgi:hypothetical protein